jgi:hypothetical protein
MTLFAWPRTATFDRVVPKRKIYEHGSVGSALKERIELAEAIAAQQKKIQCIKARLGREKQFNKRVAINAELRDAKQELERLTQQQGAFNGY